MTHLSCPFPLPRTKVVAIARHEPEVKSALWKVLHFKHGQYCIPPKACHHSHLLEDEIQEVIRVLPNIQQKPVRHSNYSRQQNCTLSSSCLPEPVASNFSHTYITPLPLQAKSSQFTQPKLHSPRISYILKEQSHLIKRALQAATYSAQLNGLMLRLRISEQQTMLRRKASNDLPQRLLMVGIDAEQGVAHGSNRGAG